MTSEVHGSSASSSALSILGESLWRQACLRVTRDVTYPIILPGAFETYGPSRATSVPPLVNHIKLSKSRDRALPDDISIEGPRAANFSFLLSSSCLRFGTFA